jgi:hypothetical protein
MCGTCDAISGNDCVQDCVGAWGGAALVDDCGVCDATPGNDCDCFQVPGGPARMDQCGVCDADAGNDCAIDCSGVWGGPDRLDMCGVCDAAAGNDCVQDCAGNWGGTATPDMCSVCDTNPSNDCVQDCAGMWGGGATVDNCDTCDANPTNDCVCLGATCAASGPCFEGYCDAQTDTCMERAFADGTECGTAGTEICVDTACVTRQCGDRFLESGPAPARETCDDGNVADGDLCSAACVATALRLTPDRGSLRAQIPTVGVDGAGRHLIVWIPDPNAPVMLARRFDAAGAPLESTAFGIPSSAYPSEIAVTGLSGGGWVVTYVQLGMNSNTVVLFRMVASDGTVGSEQVVSSRRGQNREPVITSVGTGFVIVWWVYNTWDGIDSGLVARRYSATGTALSSEFFVAVQRADYQELARVTSQGNTWLVVWQGNPGSGFQPQIRGRFFSLSNPTSGELVFANGTSPTVASLGGGEFAVGYGSWNTPYGVFVRRVPQASPLSQTANMVGWSHSSSPEIMVAPYGSSILVAWRNANIDVSLAAIGPTALNAVDALSANAELATANAWFTLSPSPRGTWFVTSHPRHPRRLARRHPPPPSLTCAHGPSCEGSIAVRPAKESRRARVSAPCPTATPSPSWPRASANSNENSRRWTSSWRAHDAHVARSARIRRELEALGPQLDHARMHRALPLLSQLRVASPCRESWEGMLGDDRVRHCGKCDKHVYNLSALSPPAGRSPLARAGGSAVRALLSARRRNGDDLGLPERERAAPPAEARGRCHADRQRRGRGGHVLAGYDGAAL